MRIDKHLKLGVAVVLGGMALAGAQTGTIGVHDDIAQNPAFTLKKQHPAAWNPFVADMVMLDDTRMVLLEFVFGPTDRENTSGVPKKNGNLWIVSNLEAADPEQVKTELIAKELSEPTGLCVANGKIYVAQKLELTEFTLGAAGAMATPRKVAPLTLDPLGLANFQEYNFGLLYKDGYFYTATGGAVRIGGLSWVDDIGKLSDLTRSGLLKIKADDGSQELLVGGLRAPNGLAVGPDGDFWVTDNQGSFLPACKLIHIVPGKNYGYTNGPNKFRGMEETPPAVWFPYGEIGKSITHPTLMKTGTFAGQFLMGDISLGGMMRASVENVGGTWQGSAHSFGGGFEAGIEASVELKSGSYVLGGLGRGDNGNWGWRGKLTGFQLLTPKAGTVNFEIKALHAKAEGIEIEFTKPVGAGADVAANYTVFSGVMTPGPKYGEGNMLTKTLITVTAVKISTDKLRVLLQLDGLAAHVKKVIAVRVGAPIKSETAEDAFRPAAWYTLNVMSTTPWSAGTAIHPRAGVQGLGAGDIAVARSGAGLTVKLPFAGSHELTLRNLQGKALETLSGKGATEYALGANHLVPGLYLIDVKVDGVAMRKSVVF